MFNPINQVMFSIVPILVTIGFIVGIGMFIIISVKGMKQWNYNNAQPVLSVEAKVVAKRTNITRHNHNNNTGVDHYGHTSTTYYATFEVESGDRMEFVVSGDEYGLLVENDMGKLSFQGTRYLGFNRER